MDIFTKKGAIDAGERAIRTFAGVLVTLLVTVQGGLLHVPWTDELATAGLAALVSLLMYVVAGPKALPPGALPLSAVPVGYSIQPVPGPGPGPSPVSVLRGTDQDPVVIATKTP